MNSILYDPAGTELDMYCLSADTPVPEDIYATVATAHVRPVYRRSDEEELYISFEEAISDRVLAVNRQLQRLSGTLAGTQQTGPWTGVALKSHILAIRPPSFESAWQKVILFAGIALILLLSGFDLMGLLVLHLH
jgi:hypothetical protein